MYKIYFAELNEDIDEDIFSKLLSFFSIEKQQRIKVMNFSIDKKLTIYAEVLVRALVCKLYEVKNCELSFSQNAHGKPQLVGYSQFHFNISHTRNAMAVVTAEKAVGIDIERIKYADLNIARRFFTEQERAYIFDKADKEFDRHRRFYEIWTQKEAYIKYIGKGLSIPLKSFDVTENGIRNRTSCFEKDGYVISVCRHNEISRRDIKIIQLYEQDLIELAFSGICCK